MNIVLTQLFKLINLLNSETGEKQIAAGISCGLILGFAPFFSLQTILVFLLLFFFRIQMGAAFASAFFFAIISYFLDPVFDYIGQMALEFAPLYGVYTQLYNAPIIPWTRFYNSIAMGAGIVSIILFPLCFYLSVQLIYKYRQTIVAKFKDSKFFKTLKATSFYKWYVKYQEFRG